MNIHQLIEIRNRAANRFANITFALAIKGKHERANKARARRNELVNEALWLSGADFGITIKSRITPAQRNEMLANQ